MARSGTSGAPEPSIQLGRKKGPPVSVHDALSGPGPDSASFDVEPQISTPANSRKSRIVLTSRSPGSLTPSAGLHAAPALFR